MALKHMDEYRDTAVNETLIRRLKEKSRKPVRIMEVCGTHTMAIFRSGIRSILPRSLTLLSGPGCPVCVTAQGEIDSFIRMARKPDVLIATFGDLMRVPGTESSLQRERAEGGKIEIVYSTFDALEIARKNPDLQVVFLGVGFETTAPTVAASIETARMEGMTNFSVLSAHKRVPPALAALAEFETVKIDGFLLPGHVSVIIGVSGYQDFFDRYQIPCAVAGFEPADILQGMERLVEQVEYGTPLLQNAYSRAVSQRGNPKAVAVMDQVFSTVDADWRGLGAIPDSGMQIRPEYAEFDAAVRFQIENDHPPEPKGCACGDVLTGVKAPPECKLYRNVCTPSNPVGPCMVSSEGTCAAYYRYHAD